MKLYSLLITKIILPIADKLLDSNYSKTLETWTNYDRLSEKELHTIQQQKLKETLEYISQYVPYYSNFTYNLNSSPEENLKNLPILTKEILRNKSTELISTKFNMNTLHKNFSSGSSGVQSFSYNEKKNKFLLQGIQGHWYNWAGYQIGDPILQFGISPNRDFPKNIKDILYRTYYQSAFSLENSDYEKIFSKLSKKKNQFIIGYPSAINEYANYLISNNLTHPIAGIISLGDKLFQHYEKAFKKAFSKPKIIDTYGCAEGLMIACRADLPYYYVMSPHLYVEIVDNDGNIVPDGELGHVLITCFTNLAQPLIRYKLGDLAIKLPKKNYPKNKAYNYPLLEKIVGRETDIIKTPNNRVLVVHSFTGIFEYYPEIKQYRIIQNKISKIKIEFIPDHSFQFEPKTLEKIKTEIDQITENELLIEFIEVTSIEATPSGKPQIIKSTI